MASVSPAPEGIPAGTGEISAEAARRELEKVVASPMLVNSAQLCRFLRYLVETTLAGDTGSIKENLLGTEVFERGIRFDPRTDPVVRVEARRLRSKLDEYYASLGAADEVIIRIPKGSYVPTFERAAIVGVERADESAVPRKRRWAIPAAVAGTVVLAGVLFWGKGTAIAHTSSLAVLPFANVGSEAEAEYFADGLTDELTDLLGRTEGLRVVARSSAYQYKGKVGDAREIGGRLQADVLLEGSVRKEGRRLRISAQLVDAHSGYQIWSQTAEREWTEVFAMQQEIAASIAAKLKVRPASDLPGRHTGNLESYNLYLKGRYYWNKRTVASLEAAIAAFREAIDKDPNYAAAWAGLADSYSILGFMEALPPNEIHQKALAAAERAIQLDDTLADGHASLATILGIYDWDWAGTEREFRRALQLNPNLPLAHYGLSKTLASLGRLPEALREIRTAEELDPLSLMVVSSRAWEFAAMRRYKEADDAFRVADDLDPNFLWSYVFRSWSYEARGQYGRAVENLQRAMTLSNAGSIVKGELAHSLGRAGRKEEAAKILAELTAEGEKRYVSPFDLSRAYEGLGRRDEAMAALARACDDHSPIVVFLKAEPVFAEWRADPRFQAILRRIHLE
jgi:TolB-like protein/Flp pilus assembly protein TadD